MKKIALVLLLIPLILGEAPPPEPRPEDAQDEFDWWEDEWEDEWVEWEDEWGTEWEFDTTDFVEWDFEEEWDWEGEEPEDLFGDIDVGLCPTCVVCTEENFDCHAVCDENGENCIDFTDEILGFGCYPDFFDREQTICEYFGEFWEEDKPPPLDIICDWLTEEDFCWELLMDDELVCEDMVDLFNEDWLTTNEEFDGMLEEEMFGEDVLEKEEDLMICWPEHDMWDFECYECIGVTEQEVKDECADLDADPDFHCDRIFYDDWFEEYFTVCCEADEFFEEEHWVMCEDEDCDALLEDEDFFCREEDIGGVLELVCQDDEFYLPLIDCVKDPEECALFETDTNYECDTTDDTCTYLFPEEEVLCDTTTDDCETVYFYYKCEEGETQVENCEKIYSEDSLNEDDATDTGELTDGANALAFQKLFALTLVLTALVL